jgi:hypothetical protein
VRDKARLVAQGFSQVEGLDILETFAHIAHLEAIRILLACALVGSHLGHLSTAAGQNSSSCSSASVCC